MPIGPGQCCSMAKGMSVSSAFKPSGIAYLSEIAPRSRNSRKALTSRSPAMAAGSKDEESFSVTRSFLRQRRARLLEAVAVLLLVDEDDLDRHLEALEPALAEALEPGRQ